MVKESLFLEKWQEVRKVGEKRYIWTQTLKWWFLLLVIFMIGNFLFYSLDFTWEEISNKLFKNIFITFIIALVYVVNVWRSKEKKYQAIKKKKTANAELQTNIMRQQRY